MAIKRWSKLDPSRTKTERQRFMREMRKRFAVLERALVTLLVTEDAFGLEKPKTFKMGGELFSVRPIGNAARQRYRFLTAPEKLRQFQQWLQQQIDAGLLEVQGPRNKPWTAQYVESAWRKGMMRAFTDVRKKELAAQPAWYQGAKEQFLEQAFLQPEMMSKVELLATRAFEGMKGITGQVSTQLSRLLADGMANGWSPSRIARQMKESLGISKARALTIARTEIIHAHAEGQLDGLSQLGVKKVGAEVEWSTAGDGLVCERCSAMEGKTFTIKEARGKLPLHPNCRCAWMPVVEKEPKRRRR